METECSEVTIPESVMLPENSCPLPLGRRLPRLGLNRHLPFSGGGSVHERHRSRAPWSHGAQGCLGSMRDVGRRAGASSTLPGGSPCSWRRPQPLRPPRWFIPGDRAATRALRRCGGHRVGLRDGAGVGGPPSPLTPLRSVVTSAHFPAHPGWTFLVTRRGS